MSKMILTVASRGPLHFLRIEIDRLYNGSAKLCLKKGRNTDILVSITGLRTVCRHTGLLAYYINIMYEYWIIGLANQQYVGILAYQPNISTVYTRLFAY